MRKASRWISVVPHFGARPALAAAFVVGGLLLAGCSAGTPLPVTTYARPTSTTAGLITPITVIRRSGAPGQSQTLAVQADGGWTYTDAATGQTSRGQLTPAQAGALVTKLTDPALTRALANAPATATCAGGVEYMLQFSAADTFTFVDCGSLPPPLQAVIQELSADTAL